MNEDEFIDFFFDEIKELMDSISEGDHVSMLNHASLIINMTPEETKKRIPETKKLLLRINKVLTFEPNMRTLRMMQKLNKEPETGIEYYSADKGRDDRLFYKENLEKEMITFEHEIRKIIAEIIKDMTQSVMNIWDKEKCNSTKIK